MRMKYAYYFFFISVFITSCQKEDGAELAKPATFVRYYNGGNDDQARDLLALPDGGFIILANSELTAEDGVTTYSRVKLIKTDAYGNVEWQKLYPADLNAATQSWRGSGVSLTSTGGYIIAGEDIQPNTTSMLVIVTDAAGEQLRQTSVTVPNVTDAVAGLAITEKKGVYFLLGRINTPVNNMCVTSLNPADLSLTWAKTYGSGNAPTLINKIFVDDADRIIWGGTVTREDEKSNMRLVRAFQNSLNTEFDLPIGNPDDAEVGNGLCRYGNGYALIGQTDESGNDDILFKRIAEDGTVLASFTFPVLLNNTDTQQNEVGNAIASTKDGGFILLGTVPSVTDLGRGGDDFYLIKLDAFGAVQWTQIFGSQNDDRSVAIAQTADGGYMLLGTTQLANVGTITLVKTNASGNIN